MSEFSDTIRREFGAADKIRDKGLTTPKDVVRYDDIRYGDDEKYNLLDIYRPKSVAHKLPVIVIVHGGAWVYGDKEVYQYYGMSLAQREFAVVNFSYRLAPENRFPAQLEDICRVFGWMRESHGKYGLDLNNVFAVGDSAGAHLLGLFADMYSNPVYMEELRIKYPGMDVSFFTDAGDETAKGDKDTGIRLRAVALNCGKYDLSKGNEMDKDTPKILNDFLAERGSREELDLTCVTKWVTGDFPPVFLMTCRGDFLKYQAPFMEKTLNDMGVPFVFKYYGNDEEPLHHVFHCNTGLESAKICNDDECGFFRTYIMT